MLKCVVKNGSQNAGNATSETQELKNFRWHAPGPLEGSDFEIGHPPFNNPRSAPGYRNTPESLEELEMPKLSTSLPTIEQHELRFSRV